MNRKLRFGMIGGGKGSFIGAVHRVAATMDGKAELAAGAFSSDPARAVDTGLELFLPPVRVYTDYARMIRREAELPADERLDFIVIATPNHRHFGPAKLALEAGFNVVCDKPVTLTVAEAKALRRIVAKTGRIFGLTHNYTGNAMVKQARALIREGKLGRIRKVVAEYPQGWLSGSLEKAGHKQADWRTDPKRSGASGCMADIGTHAENLVRYVTGLRIESLCADLTAFGPGRKLDDDGSVLLRFDGGAKGVLYASQIAIGEENPFAIRVYGTKASLEWHQERPNELMVKFPDQPRQTWLRGNPYLSGEAKRFTRVPPGHPEGFLEAFGNIYLEIYRAIGAQVAGRRAPKDLDFPTIDDGVEGMVFIDAVVRSSARGGRWVTMPRP